MTRKMLSLIAGVALSAATGVANAGEVATTASPDILGSVDVASYQSLSSNEMAQTTGTAANATAIALAFAQGRYFAATNTATSTSAFIGRYFSRATSASLSSSRAR